jgi:hypothetical protein
MSEASHVKQDVVEFQIPNFLLINVLGKVHTFHFLIGQFYIKSFFLEHFGEINKLIIVKTYLIDAFLELKHFLVHVEHV